MLPIQNSAYFDVYFVWENEGRSGQNSLYLQQIQPIASQITTVRELYSLSCMCFVRQAPTAIRHHHLVYRSRLAKSNDKSIKSVNFRFSHIDAKHEILFSATHRHVAAWSRGMIPPSGGGGRGFDSRSGPAVVPVGFLSAMTTSTNSFFFRVSIFFYCPYFMAAAPPAWRCALRARGRVPAALRILSHRGCGQALVIDGWSWARFPQRPGEIKFAVLFISNDNVDQFPTSNSFFLFSFFFFFILP